MITIKPPQQKPQKSGETVNRNVKSEDVLITNISAARSVSDTIRTSLGPRAMDKMIEDSKGEVIISNDGATILKELTLTNPVARMLVDLSKSQDVEAGDGTTTVVVMAGGFLDAAETLLKKGIHPQVVSESFRKARKKGLSILEDMAIPLDMSNKSQFIEAAKTALSSKVVANDASLLAPLAVEAVLKVMDPEKQQLLDIKDIRIVKKLGGTVEDSELVEGIILGEQHITKSAGGPSKVENAKVGLIQFCISPPKTDMQATITVKDYQSIDRIRREERTIITKMVKTIQQTGCNVLLIQKSILRDAVTDLSLDYLSKAKILVIKDVERDDVEFIAKALDCQPVASIDRFTTNRLGFAKSVSEDTLPVGGRVIRITGVPNKRSVSFLCRASNSFVLDELERSFHDAICVVRSLIKKKALITGGGSPEMELHVHLKDWARTLKGVDQLCVRLYAESLYVIPSTLAENAGMNTMGTLVHLLNAHVQGKKYHGISVKQGGKVVDMKEQGVLQPLLVTSSALSLSTETVMMILKIDEVLMGR